MQWPSLSVRVAYTQAALEFELTGSEDANIAMADAFQEAFVLGLAAFNAGGVDEPPALFADVPDLRKAWTDGYAFAEESEIMRNCSGCQNPDGTPCPIHG